MTTRGQKISSMPSSSPIQDTDWFHLVQGGANTKLVASALRIYLDGSFNTILHGDRDPLPSDGVDGDFWINTLAITISGAKESGLWPIGINIKGDRGAKGDRGDKGLTGNTGVKGDTGLTGAKGDAGANGQKGDTGAQGLQGATGAPGARGVAGKDGVGTPVGGLTGQVLAKVSALNYDFEWKTQVGGGDMLKSTYDPTLKELSAFVSANHDYNNFNSGLVADNVQFAIDEIAIAQAVGLIEYSAIADNQGGSIASDVNAMDWTGHQQAVGSVLYVETNHIITFAHQTSIAYRYVGDKPVQLGLGGADTAVDDDFFAIATGDHEVLINRDAVNSHPQSAIEDLVSDQGQQDARIGINEGDILYNRNDFDSHEGNVSNPHDVTAQQVGASPTGHQHLLADITDSGAMASQDDAPANGEGHMRINGAWSLVDVLYGENGTAKLIGRNGYVDATAPISYVNGVSPEYDGDLINRGYADNRYIERPTVTSHGSDITIDDDDGFDHWYKIILAGVTVTLPAGLPVGHRFTVQCLEDTTLDASGLTINLPKGKELIPAGDHAVIGFIVTEDNVITAFGDLF